MGLRLLECLTEALGVPVDPRSRGRLTESELPTLVEAVEASALTREDIVREVGGVPAASSHAAQLAIDALGALLASVRKT